jgi:hypothetical protein
MDRITNSLLDPIIRYIFNLLNFRYAPKLITNDPTFELDNDSLFCILDYLDQKSICACELVSKQFNNVAQSNQIWKKFCDWQFPGIINDNHYINYVGLGKVDVYVKNAWGGSINDIITSNILTPVRNVDRIKLYHIPPELELMINLTKIELDNNYISSIPKEIGNLTNLKHISLYNNSLQNIPTEIGKLVNLEVLHLQKNHLKYIPFEIGLLSNLRELYLSENGLRYLPSTIRNLTKLECLFANQNSLKSIPLGVCEMFRLKNLALLGNKLESLPKGISELTNLYVLSVNPDCKNLVPENMLHMIPRVIV